MKNLTEKSLLVSLVICQWSARKYDRKATKEVNDAHQSKDAGRFNKILIAKENLDEIQKIANKARAFHYENTLPWSDTGERLLPSANYFQYIGELSKLKNEFETAVNKFSLAYPTMIDDAKQNLNGLFNQNDYPLNILDRFSVKTSFMPVPDVSDIRVNLNQEEVEALTKTIQDEMNERFNNAQKDIFQRVKDHLDRMKERLSNVNNSFKNSLFENVLELVELLPRLNVSNNPEIFALCTELKYIYVEPDNVRKDVTLRADKAKEVDLLLSKINSFINPE